MSSGRVRFFEALFLLIPPGALLLCALAAWENTGLLSACIAGLSLLPFLFGLERNKPRPRDFMPVLLLSALASAGRLLFAAFPGVKPVAAIVICGGISFGRRGGLLIGVLTALISNFFFGHGPWTPWQMYCWGLMGYMAGVLANSRFMQSKWGVCAYGFLSCLLYGFIVDSWYLVSYVYPLRLAAIISAYSAGLPFSLIQAVATVIFLALVLIPWKMNMLHFKRKYGISNL